MGEFFPLLCGVQQGSVLSLCLFTVYVCQLRQTGYGTHVGQLFIGCALYADEMTLHCYLLHAIDCKNLLTGHILQSNLGY